MSMNPNLSFYCERLQGYSTNTFQLMTDSKTTAHANDIITFSLPSNSLLSLRSFKFFFQADAHDNQTDQIGARLPAVADFVERVEVTMGGIVLSQGMNFTNVLHEAKKALNVISDDATTGHPEYVRGKSYVNSQGYHTPGSGLTPNNENYSDPNTIQLLDNYPYFCIDHFEGFLATAEPKIFDSALVPDIKVRLHLASNSVITKSGGLSLNAFVSSPTSAVLPRYELSSMYATIECMSLADQTYDNLISSMIASQGFVEVPYKNYVSFQNLHTGSTRFTNSSQSMDRVWITWRDGNYNTVSHPIVVYGYKQGGAFVSDSSASFANAIDIGVPPGEQYVFDNNKELYQSNYFKFNQPRDTGNPAPLQLQLQLNSAMMPQFMANPSDLYEITRNSLQGAKVSKNMTLIQYCQHFFVQCFRLNLPDSEFGRLISGLDVRAVNIQGLVNTINNGTDHKVCNIFCENTSSLRIGAGRTIEVIA